MTAATAMRVQWLPVLGIARVGMVRAAVKGPVLKDAGIQRRRGLLVAFVVVVVARVGSRELLSYWQTGTLRGEGEMGRTCSAQCSGGSIPNSSSVSLRVAMASNARSGL